MLERFPTYLNLSAFVCGCRERPHMRIYLPFKIESRLTLVILHRLRNSQKYMSDFMNVYICFKRCTHVYINTQQIQPSLVQGLQKYNTRLGLKSLLMSCKNSPVIKSKNQWPGNVWLVMSSISELNQNRIPGKN